MAYAAADPIVSLYEGNRARQIADGAAPARTRVIPNGIDLDRFAARAAGRPAAIRRRVVGLIGRIVPIKDIKTFIRAMREVVAVLPDAEAWIVGPEDEDSRYAAGMPGAGGRAGPGRRRALPRLSARRRRSCPSSASRC